MAVGGLSLVGQRGAQADDRGGTTPKSSSNLRWLPYQPEKTKADGDVQPVQYTAPERAYSGTPHKASMPGSRSTSNRAASSNSLNVASEDRKPTLQPVPAVESNDALTEPALQSALGAGTPDSPAERSTTDVPVAQSGSNSRRLGETPDRALPKIQVGPKGPPLNMGDNDIPSMQQDSNNTAAKFSQRCLSVKDLEPITKLNTDITTLHGELPKDCPWGNEEKFVKRSWQGLTYTWTASALCHKPLYFEDEKLERYGHMWGPWLQPVVSHARFFALVLVLPYQMGLETPNECVYALGYYRPGSCAPYYLDPIPLSVRAGLFEAGAIVGGVAIFP